MAERRCCYCERIFQPSKYQPGQSVCSDPGCQRRRRAEYHRQKIATDPGYRQVCWMAHRNGDPGIRITGGDTANSTRPPSSGIANSSRFGTKFTGSMTSPKPNSSDTQLVRPGVAYCVAGKVNSADKLIS